MQNCWLSKKADAIQSLAGRKDIKLLTKKLQDAMKTVNAPIALEQPTLLNANESTSSQIKYYIDYLKPPGGLLATDRSKAVVLM